MDDGQETAREQRSAHDSWDDGAYPGSCCSATHISLVLPAHNEQETIAQAIREADEALAALTDNYEILVIDDGSSDATAAIVSQQSRNRPAVKLLRQPSNLGYGAALRRGFEAARGSLVAFSDADCQFDLRELDRMVLLSKDYDIVCGYRIDRQDAWHRKFYSRTYNALTRLLLGTGVRDCDCALKLFRRDVAKSTTIESDGFFVNAELLTKSVLNRKSIVEVGVTHRPRAAGRSTVSLWHVIPVATALLRFWWRNIMFPAGVSRHQPGSVDWSARRESGAVLLLLVASILLFFCRLSYPLVEPDETRYAQIAVEMVQSSNWLIPTLDGKPYLDKPPLLYWLTAVSYKVFGQSEATARLPSVLSATLTVLLAYWLGRRLIGSRGAWCGAMTLLLCGGFVLSGRFLIMDGLLTLFTTVALLAACIASRGERPRLGWWWLAGTACAAGVLTKGPVALVITVPPLLLDRWLTPTHVRLRRRDWLAFALPILIVATPWFMTISLLHPEFVGYFVGKHHVLRFVSAFNHQEPWWFYLPVLFAGMFPASLLLPGLAYFLLSGAPAARRERSASLGFLLLSATWTVGFFSLSSCKLPTYILPAVPLFCLLIGSMLDRCVFHVDRVEVIARLVRPVPQRAVVTILSCAAFVALIDFVGVKDGTAGAILDGVVVLAAAVALLAAWWRPLSRLPTAWGLAGLVALVALVFLFDDFVPELATQRSVNAEAAELHRRHPGAPVVYYGQNTHSASFYLRPEELVTFRTAESAQFRAFIDRHTEVVVVTTPQLADTLRRVLPSAVAISSERGRGRVYSVLCRDQAAFRLGSTRQAHPMR